MADLLDTTFSSPPLHSDPKLLRDPLLDVPISRFAYDQNFKKTDECVFTIPALAVLQQPKRNLHKQFYSSYIGIGDVQEAKATGY